MPSLSRWRRAASTTSTLALPAGSAAAIDPSTITRPPVVRSSRPLVRTSAVDRWTSGASTRPDATASMQATASSRSSGSSSGRIRSSRAASIVPRCTAQRCSLAVLRSVSSSPRAPPRRRRRGSRGRRIDTCSRAAVIVIWASASRRHRDRRRSSGRTARRPRRAAGRSGRRGRGDPVLEPAGQVPTAAPSQKPGAGSDVATVSRRGTAA